MDPVGLTSKAARVGRRGEAEGPCQAPGAWPLSAPLARRSWSRRPSPVGRAAPDLEFILGVLPALAHQRMQGLGSSLG